MLFDYQTVPFQVNPQHITLHPVTPDELPETLSLIRSRINNNGIRTQLKETKDLIQNKWQVIAIKREGNSDIDGTEMHYRLVVNKSLKGLREGILKEAIEAVINNPDNFTE